MRVADGHFQEPVFLTLRGKSIEKKLLSVMTAHSEDIKAEIDRALRVLSEQEGKGRIAAEIRPILYANLDRKRIDGFIEGEIGRVSDYVSRVAQKYELLSPFVNKIQTERSQKEWAVLFEKMRKWAYNFLVRKNFTADPTTQDIAEERATEAAIALLDAHFPYDADFDPWAHVIVLNMCRKYFRQAARSSPVSQQSIDDLSDTLVAPTDSHSRDQDGAEEIKSDLLAAIAQLPDARRQVIELLFLKGLKPSDAAREMGKSVGAIYSLQFNALQDLRKILG